MRPQEHLGRVCHQPWLARKRVGLHYIVFLEDRDYKDKNLFDF